ncbi:MAG: hypothetical protein WCG44_00665 [bacterium]
MKDYTSSLEGTGHQNGSQLPVEERLKIIANLIVDRIVEKQKQKLIVSEKL